MATSRSKGKSGSSTVSLDLSEVESKKVPNEGRYGITLVEATQEKAKSSNNKQIKMVFEINSGKNEGWKLYHNCSLLPQCLFNIRAVLEALGYEVPKKVFQLNLKEIIGLSCDAEVVHEIYQGKKKAVISEFINPDEEDGDEEEFDAEESINDLSPDELKELAKELGVKIKGLKSKEIKAALLEEDEEDIETAYYELFGEDDEDDDSEDEDDSDEDSDDDNDDDEDDSDDDDEDDEDEEPASKKKGSTAKKSASSKKSSKRK